MWGLSMWMCLMLGMVMWLIAIGVRKRNVDDVAVLINIFVEADDAKMMQRLGLFLFLFYNDWLVDMALHLVAFLGPLSPILQTRNCVLGFEDFVLEGASQLLMMHKPPPSLYLLIWDFFGILRQLEI